MRRRQRIPDDEWQYRDRSSVLVRTTLLELAREFVLAVRHCRGVLRVAVIGSILTDKPRPKDIDLLVGVSADIDWPRLGTLARRLKGSAQSRINSTADIFVADATETYRGRVCGYRECHPRILCRARSCGAVPHLADDLDVLTLPSELIAAPPVVLWPRVETSVSVPLDVADILLTPLRHTAPVAATTGAIPAI